MLNLLLQREVHTLTYVEGTLWNRSNGQFICHTLEDPVRDVKIKHLTGIPRGVYDLQVRYSPSLKCRTLWLQNVPDFTYILMHYGRTVNQSSGCILVGKRSAAGELTNIQMTATLVRMFADSGNEGMIEIVNL